MYQCLVSKRRPGPRVAMRWWEQEVLDLEGIRKAPREADHTEGEEQMDRTETVTDN